MRRTALLLLAALLGCAAAGSVDLNRDNFDELVFDSGKNAFVKFQAPWLSFFLREFLVAVTVCAWSLTPANFAQVRALPGNEAGVGRPRQ